MLVHYGEREHIEAFFKDGSIQLGTLRAYDGQTHGAALGDDQEGYSQEIITDDNYETYLRNGGKPLPEFGIGCVGNVVIVNNVAHNYVILCLASCLHRELCLKLKPSYGAAIFVKDAQGFIDALTEALECSGLVDGVGFRGLEPVSYQSRNIEAGKLVSEEFIKDVRHSWQFEVRAAWSVGQPRARFFRIKAPEAVKYCGYLSLEDMPNYRPNESEIDKNNSIINSIRIALEGNKRRIKHNYLIKQHNT